MKRVVLATVAGLVLAASTGCTTCGSGGSCGPAGCVNGCSGGSYSVPAATNWMGKLHRWNAGGASQLQPGPATAAVSYPYYTTRSPRDFLLDDPPSIGR